MNKNTIIAVVVVAVVLIAAFFMLGSHGASQTPQPQSAQTGATTQTQPGQPTPASASLYTSSDGGFSVNLPGTPQANTKTITSPSAGSISETDYTFVSSANGKGVLYMIVVFHYPATYQFSSNYLTGALQMFGTIINSKYPGTKVTAEPQSQFLGNAAISASVVVPFMGAPTSGNVLITTHNHNTYVVSAYGLSQSDYTAFQNSFTFTQ
jgi:hypothetical protein